MKKSKIEKLFIILLIFSAAFTIIMAILKIMHYVSETYALIGTIVSSVIFFIEVFVTQKVKKEQQN